MADMHTFTSSFHAGAPSGTVAEVDISSELSRRHARLPDSAAENQALKQLAQEMAENPGNILQKLVEVAHDLCRADTAGISLLETHDGRAVFRWEALAGVYAAHRNRTMPRDASPCGTTLDRNATQLMYMAERAFPALKAEPPVVEALLVPFHVGERPIGTVWVVAHDDRRKFDSEDARIVRTLATFASAGWQLWTAKAALEDKVNAIRGCNDTLENEDHKRAERLLLMKRQLRDLAAELGRIETQERNRLATDLHDNLAQLLNLAVTKLMMVQKEPDRWTKYIPQIAVHLHEAFAYTRTLMTDLHPAFLDEGHDLSRAVAWVAERMQRQGLTVTVYDDGEPKELDEEILTVTYRSLQELLWNVLKHAGVDEARVSLTRVGEHVKVIVQDRGSGFDMSHLLGKREDGGFGLVHVRERLDHFGGRLEIVSCADGTSMTLTVPLKNAESARRGARSDGQDQPLGRPGTQQQDTRIRVLLADDHAIVRDGLRSLIESETDMIVVGEASDGDMAVQMTREIQPDVVVTDINMPRMSGLEATQRIKDEHPTIAVIGLSMDDDERTVNAMRKAGAAAHVQKGRSFETICGAIRESVAKVKGQRAW